MSLYYDYMFKVVLIGDSSIGKSSILLRFSDDEFQDSYITTIGVDFKIKTIDVDGKLVKLQIWDTAGQERFRTISRAYYSNVDGILIIYDITNENTFDNVQYWLGEISKYSSTTVKVLIGNKSDLDNKRMVDMKVAEEFAKRQNIPFFETSAKENVNIDTCFKKIIWEMIEKKNQYQM